jgi:hypothetical protein
MNPKKKSAKSVENGSMFTPSKTAVRSVSE